jgi:hypothetical protein
MAACQRAYFARVRAEILADCRALDGLDERLMREVAKLVLRQRNKGYDRGYGAAMQRQARSARAVGWRRSA